MLTVRAIPRARRLARRLLALLALPLSLGACPVTDPERSPAADGGPGDADRAPIADLAPLEHCEHVGVKGAAALPMEVGSVSTSAGLVWGGDAAGYLLLWPKDPYYKGFGFARVTAAGELVAGPSDLWPEVPSKLAPSLAVNGDRLAVSYCGPEQGFSHGIDVCRIGVASTLGESVRAPVLFATGGVLQNALVSHGAGFIALWSITSEGSSSLYAQPYNLAGASTGPRFAVVGGKAGVLSLFQVASVGGEVIVLYRDGDEPTLAWIDALHRVRRASLAAGGVPPEVRDGWMSWTGRAQHLLAGDRLAVINRRGKLVAGPTKLPQVPFNMAPTATLGDASVLLYSAPGPTGVPGDSYLVASLVSDDLETIGPPVALSTSRYGSELQLAHAGHGATHAGVLHYGDTRHQLTVVGCTDEAPGPVGPRACPATRPADPELDDGCVGPVCHAVIRLDYLTLGLKGYAVTAGPDQPTDADAAAAAASGPFSPRSDGFTGAPALVGSVAGVHLFTLGQGHYRGFAMVSGLTGQVVASGTAATPGLGSWRTPAPFKHPEALTCGEQGVSTSSPLGELAGFCRPPPAPHDASDAAKLALSLNLAAGWAAKGPLEALVYLYAPAGDPCEPAFAEWVVVLSQRRR